MADKSAFVPVEAVTDRKGSAEVEADIDAELFGKKASETKVQGEAKSPAAAPPPPPPPPPAPPKPGKYQYKKSTTYQKSYAYARK